MAAAATRHMMQPTLGARGDDSGCVRSVGGGYDGERVHMWGPTGDSWLSGRSTMASGSQQSTRGDGWERRSRSCRLGRRSYAVESLRARLPDGERLALQVPDGTGDIKIKPSDCANSKFIGCGRS